MQKSLWEGLGIMQNRLVVKKGGTSWRTNESFYRSEEDCRFKPGTVSFAVAWFQQAMQVRPDSYYNVNYLLRGL